MNRLEGRVALITGGDGAIGLAAARLFVHERSRFCTGGTYPVDVGMSAK